MRKIASAGMSPSWLGFCFPKDSCITSLPWCLLPQIKLALWEHSSRAYLFVSMPQEQVHCLEYRYHELKTATSQEPAATMTFTPPNYSDAPDTNWTTADLCDLALTNPALGLQILSPVYRAYGGRPWYFGEVVVAAG